MSTHSDDVKRKQVGDLIRANRERGGVTIAEASRAAGLSRTTWTEVENGDPPLKKAATLGKMAIAIGVEPVVVLAIAGYAPDFEIAGYPETAMPPADDFDDVAPAEVLAMLRRLGERLDAVEQQLGLAEPARSDPSVGPVAKARRLRSPT